MEEQIQIQTYAEVQQIDSRREINKQIDNQTNVMGTINDQLSTISDTIDNIQVGDVDLTEITDKIDELDTNMITTQNQDILETLSDQQTQINSIENKLDTILNKLDEM